MPPTTPHAAASRGSLAGPCLYRVVIPAWLLIGACIKLNERSPMLLPSPVRDVLQSCARAIGMGSESDFASFLDFMLRVIVSGEFMLVAAMVMLPRISRLIAITVLSGFVAILLIVVGRGEASCGCFGSAGPPPWAVLFGDMTLLVLAALLPAFAPPLSRQSVAKWLAVSAVGVAVAFGVPAKKGIVQQPPPTPVPSNGATHVEPTTSSGSPWPVQPSTLQPYYLPQFEQWVGKPLREQSVAALISLPIPSDLETGRWIVMFFREDCEHCHAVLDRHFTPTVPLRTLLVAVPDANPEAVLPNPCSECQLRTLPKGPDWVIGTPVLLSVEDGIVKAMLSGTDPEDPAKVQALIEFRPSP